MAKSKHSVPNTSVGNNRSKSSNGMVIRIIVVVAFFGFLIYSFVTLGNIYSQLAEKKQELSKIEDQINIQEIKNDEMSKIYDYSGDELSDYIEQIARDELDYVKGGERVFVNVSGD